MSEQIKGTNYHTLNGLYEEMRNILAATDLPHEWVQLGRSALDNHIVGVCLGDGDFTKPELLYLSGVHSMEFVAPAMNLALLRHIAGQGKDSPTGRFLERCNVWFLPVLNPDGYLKVQKKLAARKPMIYARTNANGVDINRNFPTGFYENTLTLFAGSPFRVSPYHRGKEPCSEPESRVFRDFILNRNFRISMDFHSFGNLISYPYGYSHKECRDAETFREIGREMVQRQKQLKYKLQPLHKLYKVSGDIGDWLYDECRILAYCMEIGSLGFSLENRHTAINPFYWANPRDPQQGIDNNLDACLYLLDALVERFCDPE